MTAIDANAFKGEKTMTSVTIEAGVKTIGKEAFRNASRLKTIYIEGNVTKIGKNAFKAIKKGATFMITASKKTYKKIKSRIAKAGVPRVKYKRVNPA